MKLDNNDLKIVNRCIVKTSNDYKLIEEIYNSKEVRKYTKKNDKNFYKLYLGSNYIYRDANTKEVLNIEDYENCLFVNTRNMCCFEFINSDFFKENHREILLYIMHINHYNNLIEVCNTNYEELKSPEFLTSYFARNHYKEIFETLDQIIINKENKKQSCNVKRKVLNRK